MNLSLSTREQAQLSKTICLLASPFAYEHPREWVRALVDHTRGMLGGDKKALLDAPPEHADLIVHPGYSANDIAEYREYRSLLAQTDMFKRAAHLKVATRRSAFGPHYAEVMKGPYGQDYLPRVRAFDSLAFTVPLRPLPRSQSDVIQLILCSTSPDRSFTEKQIGMARLLYPAFEAGVGTFRRLMAVRDNITTLLDAGGGACALYTLEGNILHCTPALEQVLLREPKREALMERVRDVAQSFASKSLSLGGNVGTTSRYVTAAGSYSLAPSFLRGLTRLPSILVAVSAPRPRLTLPTVERIQEHFGLTPQEARVTLHLAERRTNREIANALSISIHTARHHVRHALEKLGAPRTRVTQLLYRGMPGNIVS